MPRHFRLPVSFTRSRRGAVLEFPERVLELWLPREPHRDHRGRGEHVLGWTMRGGRDHDDE